MVLPLLAKVLVEPERMEALEEGEKPMEEEPEL
jgi:hypothetical protein